MELRPYQIQAINDLRDSAARYGYKKLLLQAATGAGKTIIASSIMGYCKENNNPVLFFAHTREIVKQTRDKLKALGLDCGIMMAGEIQDHEELIQVASIQTLHSRHKRLGDWYLPPAKLVVIDEGHRSLSVTYLKMIDYYASKGAIILSLTATPIRSDGRGLGHVYEHMVQCPDIGELTKMGYLVPARYFAPSRPDLEGIKILAGDYNEKELEKRMDKPKLIGDVVENWIQIANDRQTIVFASGVKHSKHMAESFRASGISAEHIDAKTPKDEREDILERHRTGETKIVCNVFVLTEGFDCPPVSCIVMARPTRNPGTYIQMGGRGLRPYEGKKDCIIIDHSDAIHTHGLLSEFTEWTLDKDGSLREKIQKRIVEKGRDIVCKECSAIYSGRRMCPECGHEPKSFGKGVAYKDGRLFEIGKDIEGGVKAKNWPKEEKQSWYSQIYSYAMQRGYQKGWVAHTYKDKFGVWPRGLSDNQVDVGREVRAHIVKKQMNYRNMVKG